MKSICAVTAVCLVAGLLAGCRRDDQIQIYQTPKETAAPAPAAPAMPMMAANATPVPAASAAPRWTTPAGWQEVPPNGVRLGDFVVPGPDGKKAEVTITSFPGDVGGALANVNRWRHEVGLGDIAENEVVSEKAVVDSDEGKLYEMAGAAEQTVVAMIPRDGDSWFFKMRGDKDVVAGAKPAFLEFLKSVRFGENQPVAAVADPHAGMAGMTAEMAGMVMRAAPAAASATEPEWSVPTNWTESTPGPMVKKSFSIAGKAGQKATVTISVLAGEGGGALANVNRWRGQLSLQPVAEDGLSNITKSLDVPIAEREDITPFSPSVHVHDVFVSIVKAPMVDFTGTDAASQPTRMVAVSVAHGGQTWFYKLTGADAVVAREKDAFVKFVQSVRYP
jgi:hypothetical protein